MPHKGNLAPQCSPCVRHMVDCLCMQTPRRVWADGNCPVLTTDRNLVTEDLDGLIRYNKAHASNPQVCKLRRLLADYGRYWDARQSA